MHMANINHIKALTMEEATTSKTEIAMLVTEVNSKIYKSSTYNKAISNPI